MALIAQIQQVLWQALTGQNLWGTALAVFLGTLALLAFKSWRESREPVSTEYQPRQCGDITLDSLQRYCGRDLMLPIYFAVRGKVYDVTKGADFYGPGGAYHVFAGRECARALAKLSVSEADCSAQLDDLTDRERSVLCDWEKKFEEKYPVVGQVVAPKELTLEKLAAHDGSNPEVPMYISIRGTVFDVTTGKDFYGPDGVYPFAGRECARAFAMLSTEVEDCHADLKGLSPVELDQLRDWEAKFYYKYPIIGKLVDSESVAGSSSK